MDDAEAGLRLRAAVTGLLRQAPDLSAAGPRARWVAPALGTAAALLVIALVLVPRVAAAALVAAVTVVWVVVVGERSWLAWRSGTAGPQAADPAPWDTLDETALPLVTVLVPVAGEAEVDAELVAGLGALDYPVERREVLVLVDAADGAADRKARHLVAPPGFRLVSVPRGGPRTRSRLLNYGLTLATGVLVAVLDPGVRPDADLLRRAAWTLGTGDPGTAAVVAGPVRHRGASVLAGWDDLEGADRAATLASPLSAAGAAVPPVGGGVVLRRDALRSAGGFDPHAEDPGDDLALRLRRLDWDAGVVGAAADRTDPGGIRTWMAGRSRHHRGALRCAAVHGRRPGVLLGELGWRRAGRSLLGVVGPTLAALALPAVWALTAATLWAGTLPGVEPPAAVTGALLLVWSVGTFLLAYRLVAVSRDVRHGQLLGLALLAPAFLVLEATAAWTGLTAAALGRRTVDDGPVTAPGGTP
jgi:cellulose synthase/poly-beta-1,6-N-acetylglucosamine synthase-like glycosyltransferase